MTFISRTVYFEVIGELLHSQEGTHAFLKPYINILLARTLNSQGIKFAKIAKITESSMIGLSLSIQTVASHLTDAYI